MVYEKHFAPLKTGLNFSGQVLGNRQIWSKKRIHEVHLTAAPTTTTTMTKIIGE